jgi:hypothetical protein
VTIAAAGIVQAEQQAALELSSAIFAAVMTLSK